MSSTKGTHAGVALSLALIALCTACSRTPDVVAIDTQPPTDAGRTIIVGQPAMTCQPGQYKGYMRTVTDGGLPIAFTGLITFSLTESLRGEFQGPDDTSVLTGDGTADGSHFTADILDSRSCASGVFKTTLENGHYFTAGSTTSIDFYGSIEGKYDAMYENFGGKWIAYMSLTPTNTITLGGGWGATLIGPN